MLTPDECEDESGARDLEPIARWRHEHTHRGHELHGGAAMQAAVAKHFAIRSVARPPYLYRSVARRAGDHAPTLADAYLAREQLRIAQRAIVPVGLRIVAERRG